MRPKLDEGLDWITASEWVAGFSCVLEFPWFEVVFRAGRRRACRRASRRARRRARRRANAPVVGRGAWGWAGQGSWLGCAGVALGELRCEEFEELLTGSFCGLAWLRVARSRGCFEKVFSAPDGLTDPRARHHVRRGCFGDVSEDVSRTFRRCFSRTFSRMPRPERARRRARRHARRHARRRARHRARCHARRTPMRPDAKPPCPATARGRGQHGAQPRARCRGSQVCGRCRELPLAADGSVGRAHMLGCGLRGEGSVGWEGWAQRRAGLGRLARRAP